MRLTICDDEAAQAALLKRLVEEWCVQAEIPYQIRTYASAEALLFDWDGQTETDVLLLDILMGGMNGMELAQRLRSRPGQLQIIFITGTPDFVFDGYGVEAVSYLLKPVKREQLFHCLDLARRRIAAQVPEVLADTADGVRRIALPDLYYLESFGHSTVLHTASGPVESRTGIQVWAGRLQDWGFYRLHRSYLISLDHVAAITKKDVELDGGTRLPVPRGKWEEVNRAYLRYFRMCRSGHAAHWEGGPYGQADTDCQSGGE